MKHDRTSGLHVPVETFERLMPLHVRVDGAGRITGLGPTLSKMTVSAALIGQNLLEAFELRRPAGVSSMAQLMRHAGERLRLILRCDPRPIAFRGLAMPLGREAGMILNLSFGIGVVEAARTFDLTDADFAATDLAVEMMYLVEANTTAMQTLRSFAVRLQVDKTVAETQAMTDTLTGLRNRRSLAQSLERMTRSGRPFGLMHIDLDFFKAVNDTYGHAAGDHVLRMVAQVLNVEIRGADFAARVGGDEFVAIFPDLTSLPELQVLARRIIDAVSRPVLFEGHRCQISASIGITTSALYVEPSIAQMQHDADEALYASKRAGRGRATVHLVSDQSREPSGAAERPGD